MIYLHCVTLTSDRLAVMVSDIKMVYLNKVTKMDNQYKVERPSKSEDNPNREPDVALLQTCFFVGPACVTVKKVSNKNNCCCL